MKTRYIYNHLTEFIWNKKVSGKSYRESQNTYHVRCFYLGGGGGGEIMLFKR
jgi:hypothetical protein